MDSAREPKKQLEPLLQVGDFVRNKIHGYIAFIFGKQKDSILFDTLIVDNGNVSHFYLAKVKLIGHWRKEIPTELEKVIISPSLIGMAKEQLLKLNSQNKLDNLSYVELLYKLNEQEKALKNENPV